MFDDLPLLKNAIWYEKHKFFVRAVECYQSFIDSRPCGSYVLYFFTQSDHERAQEGLDRLSVLAKSMPIPASEMYEIGLLYRQGKKIKRNFEQARHWFKKAAEMGCVDAYQSLGELYQKGLGIKLDFRTAVQHFHKAKELGHSTAQQDIDTVYRNAKLATQQSMAIANMFQRGRVVNQDYEEALRWYKRAKKGDPHAYYYLGQLYENGGSENPRDLVKAVKYYQKALINGIKKAQAGLNCIHSLPNLTDEEVKTIANWYSSYSTETLEAEKWSDKTRTRETYANLERQLILNRPPLDDKRGWKIWLRDLVVVRTKRTENYIDVQDAQGDTALHLAAKNKLLKHYARLVCLKANTTLRNTENKAAQDYLSEIELRKVINLQAQINGLLSQLDQTIPAYLANHINIQHGSINPIEMKQALSKLYQLDAIKPLLDLAKLSVLGLHNFSERKKFSQVGYDSDDDDDEAIQSRQFLAIHFDAVRDTVEGMFHSQKESTCKAALGLYPINANKNIVFIGGLASDALATFIHELTHFIANEVFKNDCYPYAKNDAVKRDVFLDIQRELISRRALLDPILADVFSSPYYQKNNQIDMELIVRIPQLLVSYPDGLERLQKQAPRLLDYYQNVFLEAVKKHITLLEGRALGGWPLELFRRNRPVVQIR